MESEENHESTISLEIGAGPLTTNKLTPVSDITASTFSPQQNDLTRKEHKHSKHDIPRGSSSKPRANAAEGSQSLSWPARHHQ